MDIDLDTNTVTFRLLYAGPQGATKFVNLRGLHVAARDDEKSDLRVMYVEGMRIASFLYTPRAQPPGLAMRATFHALTAPGPQPPAATRKLLLRASDGVVFLPDRAEPDGGATRRAFTELCREWRGANPSPPALPVFVADYVDADRRLGAGSLDADETGIVPVIVPVDGDTVESVVKVFDLASAAIVKRYIEQGPTPVSAHGTPPAAASLDAKAAKTLSRAFRRLGRRHRWPGAWRPVIVAAVLGAVAATIWILTVGL